jgi:hypothetical protein
VANRPRVDDRRVINGMLYKWKTGIAWRDLPERNGPWKTVYNRFWRWARNGTVTMLVGKVRVIAEAIDELGREVSVTPASCGRISTPPAPAADRAQTQGTASRAVDGPSQLIMLSAGRVADSRPRCTWPTAGRCRCC